MLKRGPCQMVWLPADLGGHLLQLWLGAQHSSKRAGCSQDPPRYYAGPADRGKKPAGLEPLSQPSHARQLAPKQPMTCNMSVLAFMRPGRQLCVLETMVRLAVLSCRMLVMRWVVKQMLLATVQGKVPACVAAVLDTMQSQAAQG